MREPDHSRREGGGASITGRRRGLVAVIACISIYGITLSLVNPLLSLILEGRGTDGTVIGLIAAVPALGTLIVSPVVPAMIGRWGIRRFLWGNLVLEILLILALPVFDAISSWLILRFLTGATGAGLFVAAETWINEIAEESYRGRVVGIYVMTLGVSFAVGPACLSVTGVAGPAPFLVAAGFVAIAAVPLWLTRDNVPQSHGDPSSFSVWTFVRVAPTLIAAVVLLSFKESAAMSLLPVYGVRSGLTESASALMLTASAAGAVVFPFFVGWIADHVSRYAVMGACAVLGGIATCALPFAVSAGPALWVLLVLWGGVFTGVYTVAMTIVGQRFRGRSLAVANAAFGLFWGVGSFTGPALAGVAMHWWDPHGLPAVLMFAALTFLVVMRARSRQRRIRSTDPHL